jgi:hypothetical protein
LTELASKPTSWFSQPAVRAVVLAVAAEEKQSVVINRNVAVAVEDPPDPAIALKKI